MFRRRFVIVRRPRLLGAALVGGLGFAAGRVSKRTPAAAPGPAPLPAGPDVAAGLQELADLHARGSLTDAEFAAAKAKLLGS